MSDSYQKLGLSCPSGGAFHICQGNATQFIGCCASDPCANDSGKCPSKDLFPASYDPSAHDLISAQDCDNGKGSTIWYTCEKNSPPFMGCCGINPCAKGDCPQSDLIPAKLSSNPDNRAPFLTVSTTVPSSTSTPLSTSTSSPAEAPIPEHHHGLSTTAIVGVAAGVGVIMLVAIGFLMYRCGWRARKSGESREMMLMMDPSAYLPDTKLGRGKMHRDSFNTATSTVVPPHLQRSPKLLDIDYDTAKSSPDMSNHTFSEAVHVVEPWSNTVQDIAEIDGTEVEAVPRVESTTPSRGHFVSHPQSLTPGRGWM